MNKKTLVVNLYGGPGSGKSTSAAGLFYKLKLQNKKVELVTEYAKELAYKAAATGSTITELAGDQFAILEEQYRRLKAPNGHVSFIVTDSPLLLAGIYGGEEIEKRALEYYSAFNNFNVFVRRVKEYAAYGREQTEEQAKQLDTIMLGKFRNIIDVTVWGDKDAPDEIISALKEYFWAKEEL